MASCVCSLRRLLNPSLPTFVTRWGHVASSQDSLSGGVAAKGSSPSSGPVGPDDKKADKSKESRPKTSWGPDPKTGYYRPINEANEAHEKPKE